VATTVIPKVIHYCWFGGGKKSDRIERCMESWHRVMPDWEIQEWNEANTPIDNAYCREASSRGLWAMVSDYARLHVLHTHGGVYLDTDVEVRKSLEGFLRHECFVGFQVEEEQVDWVNIAVLGARKDHAFLATCLWFTVRFFEHSGQFARSPTVTTEVLRTMGLRHYGLQELKGVTIYPTSYFYPYPWYSDFSEASVSSDTHCIHHWERAWQR
jgi:mannosyltransferase OCH1-like enzyme